MLTRYSFLTAGPIQYDAAVDPEIAKQKIKTHSEVAGQANVCIFPDLNTGNNTYKVSACFWAFLHLPCYRNQWLYSVNASIASAAGTTSCNSILLTMGND